jgi:peptidoglycan/LPS O-acetylase OafA/YrhL
VVAPPPGHPRFPYYDSLRGIAALMVVSVHTLIGARAMGAPGSQVVSQFEVSIAIFFMLSAFLLYRPFVAARMGKGPRIAFREFALRRVLRILPGYWVALTLLAIYPGLTGVFSEKWWVYYGLAQTYHPVYGHEVDLCQQPPFPCGPDSPWSVLERTGGIGPAWTLGAEVAFYALLPLFVLAIGWATARSRRPIRLELTVLALLGLGSVLARLYAMESFDTMVWALKTLPTIFLWLGAGMALAVVSASLQGREGASGFATSITRRPWIPWLAAAGLFGLMTLLLEPTPDSYGHPTSGVIFKYVTETAVAILLLLPATFGDHAGGWPRRLMANRLVAWIGVIAYGLYLYHVPVMEWLLQLGVADVEGAFLRWTVLTAATLAISIALGAASYYLVERWFLRFKYRRRRARGGGRSRRRLPGRGVPATVPGAVPTGGAAEHADP